MYPGHRSGHVEGHCGALSGAAHVNGMPFTRGSPYRRLQRRHLSFGPPHVSLPSPVTLALTGTPPPIQRPVEHPDLRAGIQEYILRASAMKIYEFL